MRDHRLIDERSAAFARVIAEQIRKQPDLIHVARNNIVRWMRTCSPREMSTLEEWSCILAGDADSVIELLLSGDERATRLRQSNPFAGVLSNTQRNAILREYQARDKAAT